MKEIVEHVSSITGTEFIRIYETQYDSIEHNVNHLPNMLITKYNNPKHVVFGLSKRKYPKLFYKVLDSYSKNTTYLVRNYDANYVGFTFTKDLSDITVIWFLCSP